MIWFLPPQHPLQHSVRKAKGWSARTCGKKEESWAGRQWAYLSEYFKDMYPSHNGYLNAQALMSWLTKLDLDSDFQAHLDAVCMFDDPALNSTNALTNLHSWNLELHSFSNFIPAKLLKLIFLEGLCFILPISAPTFGDTTSTCSIPTSGRQASELRISHDNYTTNNKQ